MQLYEINFNGIQCHECLYRRRGGVVEDLLKGDTEEIEKRRKGNTKLGHNVNRFGERKLD
jgi:hypothetical protein